MAGNGWEEGSWSKGGYSRHVPVLLHPVLEALSPKDGGLYIDTTFGAGGYSRAILEAADCRVLALDRDPTAIAGGAQLAAEFTGRLTLVHTPFSALLDAANDQRFLQADGVVFDLGVSSMQLDEAERGFSFMRDGPLDMRMSSEGETAADVVNTTEETELARILYELGEERRSRAIARAIVKERSQRPFTTTGELARLIVRVLGQKPGDKHPATRSFQALRLYINDELGELRRVLTAAGGVLAPGGRLAAVSFHSLEDRIIKQFLTEHSGRSPAPSRHVPAAAPAGAPPFKLLFRKAIEPSDTEVAANPRARSARLRAAVRTEAPYTAS
jgi:16S rRNA (cytosine1402-N4)-methyltransferase